MINRFQPKGFPKYGFVNPQINLRFHPIRSEEHTSELQSH